ncbi:MAG: hypothetical protein HZA10_07250 [Nitrospirae bacterium]|nr:hypothetical protein [Nitrospirota bacterium]
MTTEEIYIELLTEIIKSKKKLFGDLAVNKIRHIKNLFVDINENVTSISGDPEIILREVLREYRKLSGEFSEILAKVIMIRIMQKYPEFNLPEEFYK